MFYLIFAFLLGGFLVLFLEYYGLNKYINSNLRPISILRTFVKPQIPEDLLERIKNGDKFSILSINILVQFLFSELKDTNRIKKWIINKIFIELQELTTTSALGRILGEIRVKDINLGCYFPTVDNIQVENVVLDPKQSFIEELNLVMDIDYRESNGTDLLNSSLLEPFLTDEIIKSGPAYAKLEQLLRQQDQNNQTIPNTSPSNGHLKPSTSHGQAMEIDDFGNVAPPELTKDSPTDLRLKKHNPTRDPKHIEALKDKQNGALKFVQNVQPTAGTVDGEGVAEVNNTADKRLTEILKALKGFSMALDTDLSLVGKRALAARVIINIVELKGPVRLKFTRIPYSHWSIMFLKEPEIKIHVDCVLKNKKLPQVASLIAAQIKRSIRKRHTFPHYKIRLKPFFPSFPNPDLLNCHVTPSHMTQTLNRPNSSSQFNDHDYDAFFDISDTPPAPTLTKKQTDVSIKPITDKPATSTILKTTAFTTTSTNTNTTTVQQHSKIGSLITSAVRKTKYIASTASARKRTSYPISNNLVVLENHVPPTKCSYKPVIGKISEELASPTSLQPPQTADKDGFISLTQPPNLTIIPLPQTADALSTISNLAPQVDKEVTFVLLGRLNISLIEISRLIPFMPPGTNIYLTITIADKSLKDLNTLAKIRFKKLFWHRYEKELVRTLGQTSGLTCKQEYVTRKGERRILIDNVLPHSPASLCDLKKGDLLVSINGIVPPNSRQATKLINQYHYANKGNTSKIKIIVERFEPSKEGVNTRLSNEKPRLLPDSNFNNDIISGIKNAKDQDNSKDGGRELGDDDRSMFIKVEPPSPESTFHFIPNRTRSSDHHKFHEETQSLRIETSDDKNYFTDSMPSMDKLSLRSLPVEPIYQAYPYSSTSYELLLDDDEEGAMMSTMKMLMREDKSIENVSFGGESTLTGNQDSWADWCNLPHDQVVVDDDDDRQLSLQRSISDNDLAFMSSSKMGASAAASSIGCNDSLSRPSGSSTASLTRCQNNQSARPSQFWQQQQQQQLDQNNNLRLDSCDNITTSSRAHFYLGATETEKEGKPGRSDTLTTTDNKQAKPHSSSNEKAASKLVSNAQTRHRNFFVSSNKLMSGLKKIPFQGEPTTTNNNKNTGSSSMTLIRSDSNLFDTNLHLHGSYNPTKQLIKPGKDINDSSQFKLNDVSSNITCQKHLKQVPKRVNSLPENLNSVSNTTQDRLSQQSIPTEAGSVVASQTHFNKNRVKKIKDLVVGARVYGKRSYPYHPNSYKPAPPNSKLLGIGPKAISETGKIMSAKSNLTPQPTIFQSSPSTLIHELNYPPEFEEWTNFVSKPNMFALTEMDSSAAGNVIKTLPFTAKSSNTNGTVIDFEANIYPLYLWAPSGMAHKFQFLPSKNKTENGNDNHGSTTPGHELDLNLNSDFQHFLNICIWADIPQQTPPCPQDHAPSNLITTDLKVVSPTSSKEPNKISIQESQMLKLSTKPKSLQPRGGKEGYPPPLKSVIEPTNKATNILSHQNTITPTSHLVIGQVSLPFDPFNFLEACCIDYNGKLHEKIPIEFPFDVGTMAPNIFTRINQRHKFYRYMESRALPPIFDFGKCYGDILTVFAFQPCESVRAFYQTQKLNNQALPVVDITNDLNNSSHSNPLDQQINLSHTKDIRHLEPPSITVYIPNEASFSDALLAAATTKCDYNMNEWEFMFNFHAAAHEYLDVDNYSSTIPPSLSSKDDLTTLTHSYAKLISHSMGIHKFPLPSILFRHHFIPSADISCDSGQPLVTKTTAVPLSESAVSNTTMSHHAHYRTSNLPGSTAGLRHKAAASGKRLIKYGIDYINYRRARTVTGQNPNKKSADNYEEDPNTVEMAEDAFILSPGDNCSGRDNIMESAVSNIDEKEDENRLNRLNRTLTPITANGMSKHMANVDSHSMNNHMVVTSKTEPIFHNDIYNNINKGGSSQGKLDQHLSVLNISSSTFGILNHHPNHTFILNQFNKGTLCQFCGKKIWFKAAYQCKHCHMICHKKCLDRCQGNTKCSPSRNPSTSQTATDSNPQQPIRPPPPNINKNLNHSAVRSSLGFIQSFKASCSDNEQDGKSPFIGRKRSHSSSSSKPRGQYQCQIPDEYLIEPIVTTTCKDTCLSAVHDMKSAVSSISDDSERCIDNSVMSYLRGNNNCNNNNHEYLVNPKSWQQTPEANEYKIFYQQPLNNNHDGIIGESYEEEEGVEDKSITKAKELGLLMLLHLDPDERRETLLNMMESVKREMEDEAKTKTELLMRQQEYRESLQDLLLQQHQHSNDTTTTDITTNTTPSKIQRGIMNKCKSPFHLTTTTKQPSTTTSTLSEVKGPVNLSKQQQQQQVTSPPLLSTQEIDEIKTGLKICEQRLESLSLIMTQYTSALTNCSALTHTKSTT